MNESIRESLIDLNNDFYSNFADSFSATRGRLQPGVLSITADIPADAYILDLGCGNGQFLFNLGRSRFRGSYIGLDFSPGLLENARALNQSLHNIIFSFLQADLTRPSWNEQFSPASFDVITSFATLHHIPGSDLHLQILHQAHDLLKPDGLFIFSVWQFINSRRLVDRILPWETICLTDQDVDPGDYLLDWRAEVGENQVGKRYVHLFDESALEKLRLATGFELQQSFYSDGKEGNLALYQTWIKT